MARPQNPGFFYVSLFIGTMFYINITISLIHLKIYLFILNLIKINNRDQLKHKSKI